MKRVGPWLLSLHLSVVCVSVFNSGRAEAALKMISLKMTFNVRRGRQLIQKTSVTTGSCRHVKLHLLALKEQTQPEHLQRV